MRTLFVSLLMLFSMVGYTQSLEKKEKRDSHPSALTDSLTKKPDPAKRIDTAEVSCGQCNFKLDTQKGCDLAIRINGKAYFVDGTRIDDHGDAHAADGFCSAVRKAIVQGEVVDGRFKATYFALLPSKKEEVKHGH